MKKIISSITCILIAIISTSCNSDDNSVPQPPEEKTTEITVLSTYQYTSKNYPNIEKNVLITFNYNQEGVLVSHLADYEYKENNTIITKDQYQYTYSYNPKRLLGEIKEVDSKGKVTQNLFFEYDNNDQMTSIKNNFGEAKFLFKYNTKKQIINTNGNNSSNTKGYNFEYDDNGNYIKITNLDSPNVSESYTYNTSNNPFKNMPVNVILNYGPNMASDIMYYHKPINNIDTYNRRGVIGKTEYQYNTNKYPTHSTSTDNTGKSEEKFTYKTIVVDKK